MEPNNDISHLNASVVDIVLHFHRSPRRPQHSHEVSPKIAFRRWPICAALLGLIGASTTLLRPLLLLGFSAKAKKGVSTAFKPYVDIAVSSNFESRDAFNRTQPGD